MSENVHFMGRKEADARWFARRDVMQAAVAFVAAGGWLGAVAQERSNVVRMTGDVMVNGQRLQRSQTIQTGDEIQTGLNSSVAFVIGNASFLVRPDSRMTVERGGTLSVVSVLRLVSGGVASVWGKGQSRQVVTPTLTAGIRGTGVYAEVLAARGNVSYFCNCYGVVDLAAGAAMQRSEATYHDSVIAEPDGTGAMRLVSSPAINHTDEELEFLARLVNQRTAWQISGVRGGGSYGPGAPAYGPPGSDRN